MPQTATPLDFEPQPAAAIAKMLRDEMRSTSPSYAGLVRRGGLGVAEEWIAALEWGRSDHRWGVAQGWYLSASAASERVCHRSHTRPTPGELALGLRTLAATKRDYEASPLAAALAGVFDAIEASFPNDRDIQSF